jgi:hypothetical protein
MRHRTKTNKTKQYTTQKTQQKRNTDPRKQQTNKQTSDSTHHFFRNACTNSGSLRFSQFFGCWLILSVYILIEFWLSLWKIVRSSVILLLSLFILRKRQNQEIKTTKYIHRNQSSDNQTIRISNKIRKWKHAFEIVIVIGFICLIHSTVLQVQSDPLRFVMYYSKHLTTDPSKCYLLPTYIAMDDQSY